MNLRVSFVYQYDIIFVLRKIRDLNYVSSSPYQYDKVTSEDHY